MTVSRPRRRGTYAPLAARYYEDERIMRLSEGAELLYVRVLAFCASSMSDGFISDAQLATCVGVVRGKCRRSVELVTAGLWRRDDEARGFHVTSWLKWNPSAKDIRAAQEADAARKRSRNSGRNPAGNDGNSGRNPARILPSDTDTDTELPNRTPSGSVRLGTRDGRSRAPQAAPRPSPVLSVANPARPPDLTQVRAMLASAGARYRERNGRRPDALARLRALADGPPESDSGGSE